MHKRLNQVKTVQNLKHIENFLISYTFFKVKGVGKALIFEDSKYKIIFMVVPEPSNLRGPVFYNFSVVYKMGLLSQNDQKL